MDQRDEARPLGAVGLDEAFSRAAENASIDSNPTLAAQATKANLPDYCGPQCPPGRRPFGRIRRDHDRLRRRNFARRAREADDAAILENFRGFDAAARTARRCAEQLRNDAAPFLGEGAR
jgi:hypothetical protein